MPQLTKTVKFTVSDEDDNTILTIPLTLLLDYTPGEKPFLPHGRFTDPEHYDPGSAPELKLISVFTSPEMNYVAPYYFKEWADNWIEQNQEWFCAEQERK